MRDAVGVDGDQADRALALERAEPLLHARGRQAEAAARRRDLDRDQVAVLRVAAGAGGIASSRPSCFLSIGDEPAAAVRQRAEDAEHALLGAVDDLDDAARVWRIGIAVVAGSPRPAAARGRRRRRLSPGGALARDVHADFRRGAVRVLVPFGRHRDQFAVAVARGDVGDHDVRQGAGMMQLLAAALDRAFVGKLAQHALERGAVGILQAEGARDLAGADLAGLLADEGEEVVFGGSGRFGASAFHENESARTRYVQVGSPSAARWRTRCLVNRHLAALLRAGFFSAHGRLAAASAWRALRLARLGSLASWRRAACDFAAPWRRPSRRSRLGDAAFLRAGACAASPAASCRCLRCRAPRARRAARPPARA